MKKMILLVISLCYFFIAQSQTLTLTVTVNNVKSSKGAIKICIFNKKTGFPEKANLAVKCINSTAVKGAMQIKMDGIAPGNYAIAAYHDANNDGKFNTIFLGIRTESAGASNSAKGKMSPPKLIEHNVKIDKNNTNFNIMLD